MELSRRRLDKEQQLMETQVESSVNVVTGADVSVEGVSVPALVDTGSQSTIISRSFLHKVFAHVKTSGKELPRLEQPCTNLFRGKGGHPIVVTAQVVLTISTDGKSISVPTRQ